MPMDMRLYKAFERVSRERRVQAAWQTNILIVSYHRMMFLIIYPGTFRARSASLWRKSVGRPWRRFRTLLILLVT